MTTKSTLLPAKGVPGDMVIEAPSPMPVIDLESSGIASGQGMVTYGWGRFRGCRRRCGCRDRRRRRCGVGSLTGGCRRWFRVAVGAKRDVVRGWSGRRRDRSAGRPLGHDRESRRLVVVWRIPAAGVASMLAVGVGVGAWVGGIVAGGSVAPGAHAKAAHSRATPAMVARSLLSMGGMVARNNRQYDYRAVERFDGLDGPFDRGLPVL